MNRANFGNVITNGQQIISVGATTASRMLGHAETALNNLTKDERTEYYQMRADKMRDEIAKYKESKQSIDEAIGPPDENKSAVSLQSEQDRPRNIKIGNDIFHYEMMEEARIGIREQPYDLDTGKIIGKETVKERINKLGGNKDANV